ncbi:J domain-containing protein [Mucor ambiguus]|uniref:J domain-containing protein n=1 Tax=Mucor ambiguus TaxID=91626 RepID=A0A0C9M7N0_9FUNG|nr:J domain-containing protein [Mucor ambiguus]
MQSLFDIKKVEVDLYSILNCVDTSSPEQIKTEYKRLALKYHPDKNLSDSKEFQEIKAAYEIVGDPVNRALYERWKSSSLIIPFSEFAQIGTHAQTVHWQSLPTQMALTENDNTNISGGSTKSLRVPQTTQQLSNIPIKTTGFWSMKSYSIQENQS